VNLELVLTEIRILLENRDTGTASDVLFEFLLDCLGKPTAIDLPANVGTLPPKIVVSHLRRTLNKLLLDAQYVDDSENQDESFPDNSDLDLILQTSNEYEARQREYIPGEEERQQLKPLRSGPRPSATPITTKPAVEQAATITEVIEPQTEQVIEPIPPTGLPDNSQDNIEILDATYEAEDEDYFTELEQEKKSEIHSDGEWLLDDDLFYDGEEDRAELIDVESHGKISREERAWQIAHSLGTTFDWDDQGIALLQEIFFERGWQQARVAMESLMRDGMTSEQLMYAKELKESWDLRTELTIAFYYTRADRSTYCYSGEKVLSWRVAIEIIKSLDGCNDFDEIEQFVEEAFDAWYSNGRLRHDYRSFLQYLRSVAEHRECLSSNLLDLEPDEEIYMDTNDYLYGVLSTQLQKYDYGINLRPDIWQCAY